MYRIIIIILATITLYSGLTYSQKFNDLEEIGMNYYGSITTPDFPKNIEWLITDKPYSIKDFKGNLVLIDFWTYCCINCIHIMPEYNIRLISCKKRNTYKRSFDKY